MIRRYAFLALITLGASSAAYSLLPGDHERMAMLERDGRHEDAMAELGRQYDAGRRDSRTVLALYNLKVRFGEIGGAQRVIEEYARDRPRDVQAQLGLVRFYQTTQQESLYVAALRSLNDKTRSREIQDELVGYYRASGRYREEEELLEKLSRANRASPAELERLGLLAAARGDLQRASRALRRADGRLGASSRATRVALFQVLVDLKEHEDAHRRAIDWLRTWSDTSLVTDLMERLATAGRVDLALDLGTRFGGPGTEATLVSAELLAEQARFVEVQALLRTYAANRLPESRETAARYVALAVEASDMALAVVAARHIGLRKLPGDVVADLIDGLQEAAYGRNRAPVSIEYTRGLSAEIETRLRNVNPVGEEAPDVPNLTTEARLFVARLAILDNDLDLARRHLAGVDPDKLDAGDLAEWTELQLTTGLRAAAFPATSRTLRRRIDITQRRIERQQRQQLAAAKAGDPAVKSDDPGTAASRPAGAEPAAKAAAAASTQLGRLEPSPPRVRKVRRKTRYLEGVREARRVQAAKRSEQAAQPKVEPAQLPKPIDNN
jgi:hypothetical protein